MGAGIFVTGTDTAVGKTVVGCGLVLALRQRGLLTGVMKPVASGCALVRGRWRNDDALALQAAADTGHSYDQINPFAYAPAIAPHLAAEAAGRPIELPVIADAFRRIADDSDVVVVEGAGGWRVPLGGDRSMADIARSLNLPVLLVVAVRLGCLNHALLTAEAIAADGCRMFGWVANLVDPADPSAHAQVETLRRRLSAPLLAVLPSLRRHAPEEVAPYLDASALNEALASTIRGG